MAGRVDLRATNEDNHQADSKRDILIVGLRNAYALKGQALSTMRNVESRLEHYPQLKTAVSQHIGETERQQQIVEACLGGFGETPSALKVSKRSMP